MFTSYRRTMALAVAAVTVGLMLAEAGLAKKPSPPTDGPPVFTFMEGRNDVWSIKTVDENGRSEFTVTSGPDILAGNPRWSPDGVRIGNYKKWVGDGTSHYDQALMSIRSDGTDERVVVHYAEVDALNVANGRPSAYEFGDTTGWPFGDAEWSPDGQFMVVSATAVYPEPKIPGYNNFKLLYLVDLSKPPFERVTQLTSAEGLTYGQRGDEYPRWSWSLNKIVFASSRGRDDTGPLSHRNLWLVSPDGTGLRKLMDYDVYGSLFSFVDKAWTRGGTPDPENRDGGASQLCLWSAAGLVLVDIDLSQADPIGDITPLYVDGGRGIGNFSPNDTSIVVQRLFQKGHGWTFQFVIADLLTGVEQVILDRQDGNGWSGLTGLIGPDWNPVSPSP